MSILLKLETGPDGYEQPGYLALLADDSGERPALAVVDADGNKTVLVAAPEADIASSESPGVEGGPPSGAEDVDLYVAWNVIEPPAPALVESRVTWCRAGLAVSVSGYSQIIATQAATGFLAVRTQDGAGGFDKIVGRELDPSDRCAFGTVVVEDMDGLSPTVGQVVGHGFMHTNIEFSVPAAGTYRVHFSGHLSVTAVDYVTGA